MPRLPPRPRRRPRRSRPASPRQGPPRHDGPRAVAERALAGLLTEQFVEGVCLQAGNAPPWLTLGLATYMASQVEPRSPYYLRLHADVADLSAGGGAWSPDRARKLLNEGDASQHRAAGLSFLEFLSSANPGIVAPFVRNMIQRPGEFDNLLKQGLGTNNLDPFLNAWGQWIGQPYLGR